MRDVWRQLIRRATERAMMTDVIDLRPRAARLSAGGLPALAERLKLRRSRGVFAQPASNGDISTLHAMMREQFEGPLAPVEAVCRVQQASPNSVWSVYGAQGLVGGIAFLPLNALGVYLLISGKLDVADPPLAALAVKSERPAILYAWAVVARPAGLFGLADVLRHLDTQRFRNIDIWANAVTPDGIRLAARLGLERFGHRDGDFYKYGRERR